MPKPFGVRQQLVLLGLVFLLSFFLRPSYLVVGDHQYYLNWTEWFVSQGIPNAFGAPSFDYGPLAVYLLAGFGLLLGSRLDEFHIFLRQFYFLFDLAAIFLLMRYLERSGESAMRALFVLFNVAFLYNSLLWGQTDGIFTAIVFASLLAALAAKPELAVVLFVVAFNLKPQPIIYLPLVGLLLVPCWIRQPRRLVTTLGAAAAAQLVLLLPFISNGAWRDWIASYFKNVSAFPIASMTAHNLWYLILAGDPAKVADTTTFLQVSFKSWGLLMFSLFGFLALLPMGVRVAIRAWQRAPYTAQDGSEVFLAAGVITLGFFFFNTEMHERYAFPSVFFFGAYAMLAHDYFSYILVSVAHLLNINYYFLLSGMSLQVLVRNVTPDLVAALFLVAVVVGLIQLYRGKALAADVQELAGAYRKRRAKSVSPVPAI